MNINYGGDRDPPPAAARPGGYSSLGFQTSAGASPPAASPEEERWRAANRNELTNDLEEIEKFMRDIDRDEAVDEQGIQPAPTEDLSAGGSVRVRGEEAAGEAAGEEPQPGRPAAAGSAAVVAGPMAAEEGEADAPGEEAPEDEEGEEAEEGDLWGDLPEVESDWGDAGHAAGPEAEDGPLLDLDIDEVEKEGKIEALDLTPDDEAEEGEGEDGEPAAQQGKVAAASAEVAVPAKKGDWVQEAMQSRADAAGTPCTAHKQCRGGKMCVRKRGSRKGTCECPILNSGNDKCTAKPAYLPQWCVLHFRDAMLSSAGRRKVKKRLRMRWNKNGSNLQNRADWSNCAVVGSSGSLRKGRHGPAIDKHSAVIRFNDAPTKRYSRKVGKKTTLRIQNIDYCGYKESRSEMCLHYSEDGKKKCRRSWLKGCRKVVPSDRLKFYVQYYWAVSRPPMRGPKHKLSAGFFGIALALNLCGSVDFYGFSQSRSHYYNKHKKNSGGKGGQHRRRFGKRHSWNFERSCLNYLKKVGATGKSGGKITYHP